MVVPVTNPIEQAIADIKGTVALRTYGSHCKLDDCPDWESCDDEPNEGYRQGHHETAVVSGSGGCITVCETCDAVIED